MNSAFDTTSAHGESTSAADFGTAVAAAAIAFGVGYLAITGTFGSGDSALDSDGSASEMDTTEHLLSGGNRERILAALRRRKEGSFIRQNRTEEWA